MNISTCAESVGYFFVVVALDFGEYLQRHLRVLWTLLAQMLPLLTIFDLLASVTPTIQTVHLVRRYNKQEGQSPLFSLLDFDHLLSGNVTGFKRV